jgi:hypothetical protein
MIDRKVYEPDELKALLDAAEVPPDDRPRYLLPLHLLLPLLKREIGPIGKSGQMVPQVKDGERKGPTYAFRKIEDILNEGHGPLVALGIHWRKVEVLKHELKANGKAQECVMTVRYEIVGPLGDSLTTEATGQAVDFGSDKATNKADTSARKNMLVDLLQLATEDPDSERPDRVDERPHVQRVSEAQYAEVADAIKALPEAERERVKDWAAERGMVVTKAQLTRGDYAQLKPYVASRAKAAAAGKPEASAPPADDPEPAPNPQVVDSPSAPVENPARRPERSADEHVTQADIEHLNTVMADLTDAERARIKAEREERGFSIKSGQFTVGTLQWLIGRAGALVHQREAAEQLAAAAPPAPPADAGAARRQAGGAKLASKVQRETVAKQLGELTEAKRAEVEQWAQGAGHRLGDQLAADSFQPVMTAIANVRRTASSGRPSPRAPKAPSAPPAAPERPAQPVQEEPPAPDPDEARRELRRVQWQTLNDAVEALGVEETWPMLVEELVKADIALEGATLANVTASFLGAGADFDEWVGELVEQYKAVADEYAGRPYEPAATEAPANLAAQVAVSNSLDDVDF